MSTTHETARLTFESARLLVAPVVVNVRRKDDGSVVEQVTVMRYAGHYRTSAVHAFAVKDAHGKFRIRSEAQLGLSPESDFEAILEQSPVEVDLRTAEATIPA